MPTADRAVLSDGAMQDLNPAHAKVMLIARGQHRNCGERSAAAIRQSSLLTAWFPPLRSGDAIRRPARPSARPIETHLDDVE